MTPTCRELAPLVANCASGLSSDIVDSRLTVKELIPSPLGIVFEPLDAPDPDEGDDDPQPAATKATAATRLTPATGRSERERQPPLFLLRSRMHDPFHPNAPIH